MKIKEGITHFLIKVSVWGELEGASWVLVNADILGEIEKARQEINRMREAGLEVAKISLYACYTWVRELPPVTDEFAGKILLLGDYDEWDDFESGKKFSGCEPANDADEFDQLVREVSEVSVELERLNVYSELFSVTANLKHSETEMGCSMWDHHFEKTETLEEFLNYIKEEI